MGSVPFHSILFEQPEDTRPAATDEPACFRDLNLDQIVDRLASGEREYLRPLYQTPLLDPETVTYRQEIMRDLSGTRARGAVEAFVGEMQTVRRLIAGAHQSAARFFRERLFLDGASAYCGAISSLMDELSRVTVTSRGLGAFREYLAEYTAGETFTTLVRDTRHQYQALSGVTYNLRIGADRVTVSRYSGEVDYTTEVQEAFGKLQTGAANYYLISYREWPGPNPIEAQIFEFVARLFPNAFASLESYCERHRSLLDECVDHFDRDVQFYLAYLDLMDPLLDAGLNFCHPEVSGDSPEVSASDSFDLALACKLAAEGSPVVSNSFHLGSRERIIVVTGPNGGGKTTFARMVGQLHYLSALGLPVPGTGVRLSLPDRVFTHFERGEIGEETRGKLEDELLRARHLLTNATGRSVVIINEGFTSTTLGDALFLGTEVLTQMIRLGLLGVYVTFVDELAALDEATVSLVAPVDETEPTRRSFRIVRGPPSGLAYAAAIANEYGLGYERLKGRLAP